MTKRKRESDTFHDPRASMDVDSPESHEAWMASNFLHSAIDVDQVILFRVEEMAARMPAPVFAENEEEIRELVDLVIEHGTLLRKAGNQLVREQPSQASTS